MCCICRHKSLINSISSLQCNLDVCRFQNKAGLLKFSVSHKNIETQVILVINSNLQCFQFHVHLDYEKIIGY